MRESELKVAVIVLLLFLSMFYGALVSALEFFPYKYLKPYLAVSASVREALKIKEYNEEIRWIQKTPNNTGVVFSSGRAGEDEEYTLYSSTHDLTARLIDHKGDIIHKWSFKYDDVWDNQDHIISLGELDNFYFYLRAFHLFDNGDILLLVSAGGTTPWGVGLVKLDKDSNVLWSYTGYPNNDFEVGPDGTIYAIVHKIRESSPESYEMKDLPFLEDNIVVLSPDGEEIKTLSLIDALDNSPYNAVLASVPESYNGDPTHSNSVDYIYENHPDVSWMKKGYLLISIRNLNVMAVLDPETGNLVYANGLISRMQHDLDILPNGHLMVFDNHGSMTEGGYTRVIEFDPQTQEIYWIYDPDVKSHGYEFHNKFWGMQQRLSDGRTMIVDPEYGRIFEVDEAKNIVWDYRVPMSEEIDGELYIPVVTMAERIDSSQLQFLLQ
ncbi:MAG: aryl-sulfate sulfotransferase [Rhodospirillales bacterium]|nr:aryl-sulfate sulfotransferase [Rhodospirillales bacterium]